MSDQNIEIVRRGFDALRHEGVDGFLEFIHGNFITETPAELALEPDTYVGREGIRRWFESFYDAVDEIRFEPEEFMAVGDKVVVDTRLVVRGRDSGIEAEQRLVQVWTLREGLAFRLEVFAEREKALEAAHARD